VVAAPTSLVARAPRRFAFARVDAAAAPLLAALVGLSFAVRLVVGWLRATPNYFSDEYLYAELGRSLVESGRPLVRGVELGFPALLQPLVTAPAWLADDVWLSYRLIQALGALAMSLAAVPAYLLARRVGATRPLGLGVAAFTLAIPDLLFASWVLAEPFAYPLLLGAVLTATTAIAEPSRRNGLIFVACAGLAVFARAQFAVLPLCFLAAAVAAGLRERRLRATLREQALPLAVFGGSAALAAVVGVSRVLGLYESALDGRADPLDLAQRIGLNALVLAYSSAWILIPGALVGFALAFARPRSRGELAFAAFSLSLAAALLLQAGLVGAVEHAQERYVFYVLPLLAVAFCLFAARGWPGRLYVALVAAALVAASATVPLAGFAAAEGKAHSPLLLAAFRVEEWLGSSGSGSLAFAAAAALLLSLAVALSFRPRVATPTALALAVAASAFTSTAAASFDLRNSEAVRNAFLPAERSWVDRHGLEDVVLVRGPDSKKTEALEQLFWNRSVDRVVLLPGAEEIDHVRSPGVRIGADGTLLVAGRPLRTPLLVDGFAGTIRLANAEVLDSSPSYELWRPRGGARLSLYLAGRYSDGWLAGKGRLFLWPRRPRGRLAARVSLTLTAPEASGMTLRFQSAGGPLVSVRLGPAERKTVVIPVCSRGPSHVTFFSSVLGVLDGRIVSAHASEPQLLPARCAPSGRRGTAA
jgi:type III secretory pathway component EscS